VRNFARSLAVVFFVVTESCVGEATRIEVKIGPEPSVTAIVGWEVSSRLSFAFSFGVHLGSSGMQTRSAVLQTPSYTIGAEARYQIGDPEAVVSPYFGAGGQIWLQGAANRTLPAGPIWPSTAPQQVALPARGGLRLAPLTQRF